MIEMGRWMMVMMMSHGLGFNTKIGVCLFLANIEYRQNIYIYRSLAHGSDACQKLWAWTVDTFNFVATLGLVLTYAFFKGLL